MADAYLLEDGSGRYLLEDGSGVYLLDVAASGTYDSRVKGDGAVGYWRLGEAAGIVAAAVVGTSGTYYNSPTLGATGLISGSDTSVSFDGVNDTMEVANAAYLNRTATVSVEAWINPTSIPAAGAFRSVAGQANSYGFQWNGTVLEWYVQFGATKTRLQAAAADFVAGQTYHIVGTYDGSFMRFYKNGTLLASVAQTGTINQSLDKFRVGTFDGTTELFAGRIDEVAIYDPALTATQVADHYALGTGSTPPVTPPADTSRFLALF